MNSKVQPAEPVQPSRPQSARLATDSVTKSPINRRQRFLDACLCQPLAYPPVWLMRQAGRALPEYRALKEKYTFLQLVQTPELATEVTLQPIRRFQFDAAILFCDILVVAEGLGQGYSFRDKGGITMDFTLQQPADIDRLTVESVIERLQYVAKALAAIKSELAGQTALIGFAGSPWTLANFMMEGGGVKEYTKAKQLFYSDPAVFARLMEKLTKAITSFLRLQIEAGADALQIFDSLGGVLSDGNFMPASGQWIKQIVTAIKGQVPVIVFSKGTHGNWKDLSCIGAAVLGLDSNVQLAEVCNHLPKNVAVQGNLDPFLLSTQPKIVAEETRRILSDMCGRPGHIFNLGHGVPPNAKIENIECLLEMVRSPDTSSIRG